MTRGRAGPTQFPGDWSGAPIADGYTGYDEVIRSKNITRAGCWSHARRKFKEAPNAKRSTLPKSNLGKAVGYLFSQRKALVAFLGDPRLLIHNNDSERDLRHLAVGRNYWLVFGNQRGGEVACRLYSLILSCKQCGANHEAYLEDVLMKVATTSASEITTLTP